MCSLLPPSPVPSGRRAGIVRCLGPMPDWLAPGDVPGRVPALPAAQLPDERRVSASEKSSRVQDARDIRCQRRQRADLAEKDASADEALSWDAKAGHAVQGAHTGTQRQSPAGFVSCRGAEEPGGAIAGPTASRPSRSY